MKPDPVPNNLCLSQRPIPPQSISRTTDDNTKAPFSRLDGNFERATAVHLVEGLLVFLKLEDICDHALCLHLAAVEIRDRSREAERLREGADDLRRA